MKKRTVPNQVPLNDKSESSQTQPKSDAEIQTLHPRNAQRILSAVLQMHNRLGECTPRIDAITVGLVSMAYMAGKEADGDTDGEMRMTRPWENALVGFGWFAHDAMDEIKSVADDTLATVRECLGAAPACAAVDEPPAADAA